MKTITVRNEFHNSEARLRLPDNNIISASVYNRVRRDLCGNSTCRCFSSSASGPDCEWLGQARPIYGDGGRIAEYELPTD